VGSADPNHVVSFRDALALGTEFGYRSVHLHAFLTDHNVAKPEDIMGSVEARCPPRWELPGPCPTDTDLRRFCAFWFNGPLFFRSSEHQEAAYELARPSPGNH
jgi:hypothetical protein